MKVAAIQMVSTGEVQENLRMAGDLLDQAAAQGAELAVLPEYFCLIGQSDGDKLAIQEPFAAPPDMPNAQNQPIQTFLSGKARSLGIWVVAGTLPVSYTHLTLPTIYSV